jgi:glycerophosphoryl diester phosphodiesterase
MKCKYVFLALFLPSYLMAQLPIIQGHRGCRGLFPENSLPAFAHALKIGVRVLEMDVCVSSDGQVVVSHEPVMNALYTSKPEGSPVQKEEEESYNLYQMPYAEIKKFDVGQRGNVLFPEQAKLGTYKPLLAEVLALGEAFRNKTGEAVYYNIEIKSDPKGYGLTQPATVDEFSKLVWAQIQAQVKSEYVMLQSFDFAVLKYWALAMGRGEIPKVALSALVTRKSPEAVIKDLGFVPAIYSSNFTDLTKSVVEKAHALGMKVIPWTANETQQIQGLLEMGVDGVITDYPNRAPKIH